MDGVNESICWGQQVGSRTYETKQSIAHMHMERSVEFPARGFYSPAQKYICFYGAICAQYVEYQ